MSETTHLIQDEAVQKALVPSKLIPVMAQVFRDVSSGSLKMLPRGALFHTNGNIFAVMSAALPSFGVCGCKAAIFPGPATAAANTQQSVVLLFDLETGALKGIVSAEHITVARTAASTAAATDALALPDASVLCLLGAGNQAMGHARAICAIRPIREIRVWDVDSARAQAACATLTQEGLGDARPTATAEEAVRGAQIICTVSKAKEPILYGDWLMPGAHVNAVGACSPMARELDLSVLKRGQVYVDQRQAVLESAGDLLIPMKAGQYSQEEIRGEIGEVLNGSCPGRAEGDRDTVTVYETTGLAAQDVAAAYAVLQNTTNASTFQF